MKDKKTAIIIKTAFSNSNWNGPCFNPLEDRRCFICTRKSINVNWGAQISTDEKGYCLGQKVSSDSETLAWCWEQRLCIDFCWGNTKGNFKLAYKGMRVYFVYLELDGTLTLFAYSTIKEVHNKNGNPDKPSYLIFNSFEPLPEEKRIKGLIAEDIVGTKWSYGRYRYLNERQDLYLWNLINKEKSISNDLIILPSSHDIQLNIWIKPNVIERLKKIALEEGREINDLIREAIAKYIKDK